MGSAALALHETPQSLGPVAARAQEYARRSRSPKTLRGYSTDWKDFTAWCQSANLTPLPAEPATVAMYISAQAETRKLNTIQRRLAAVSQMHQLRGFESPTKSEAVRSVMKGIRRTLGVACDEKAPLLSSDLREMVSALPPTLNGKRDRALLLLGFGSGLRRSELVALDVEDLRFHSDALQLRVRRSKADQFGFGSVRRVPITLGGEYCPVAAIRAWLDASGITTGPLFRPVALRDKLGDHRLSDRAVDAGIAQLVTDSRASRRPRLRYL